MDCAIPTIVIAIQIPIVLLLILLTLNAFKVLKEKYFEFIFFAWVFNFLHVTFTFIRELFNIGAHTQIGNSIFYIILFLDIGSSYLFWLGAIANHSQPEEQISFIKKFFPKSQIYLFSALCLIFIVNTFSYINNLTFPIELLKGGSVESISLLMAILSFYFLYRLSTKYKNKKEEGYLYLCYGTLAYGLLQFLGIFNFETKQYEDAIMLCAYLCSLFFKSIMLWGMYKIFLADAKKKSETEQINIGLNKILGRTYHEITTPMKTMQRRLTELTDEKDDTIIKLNRKAQEKIDIIETNYNRLIAVVTASMKLYENGIGSNFDPEIFPIPKSSEAGVNNINTIIEIAIISVKDQIKEGSPAFDEESINFNREYGKHCNVFCSQTEITQSIINILTNSIDAFSGSGGDIYIRTRRFIQESNGQSVKFVRVEIADTGPGIHQELQSTVYQEGFSTKPGIFRGYGMHFIKSLVEKNRGIVDIKSPYEFRHFASDVTSGTLITLVFPSLSR